MRRLLILAVLLTTPATASGHTLSWTSVHHTARVAAWTLPVKSDDNRVVALRVIQCDRRSPDKANCRIEAWGYLTWFYYLPSASKYVAGAFPTYCIARIGIRQQRGRMTWQRKAGTLRCGREAHQPIIPAD